MSAGITHRTRLVYGGLAALWVLVTAWLVVEHLRVRRAARAELVNRARDISTTLGLVIRSQRRFGGFVSRDRIESALASLIRPGELDGIALLNDDADIVASAGTPLDVPIKTRGAAAEYWFRDHVVLMNLVDLGTNVAPEPDARSATIIVSREEMGPFGTNRPPAGATNGPARFRPPPEPDADGTGESRVAGPIPPPPPGDTNAPPRGWRGRRGDPRFPRPFWMSEQEYRSLAQRQGVHSFALILSTATLRTAVTDDLWVRGVIAAFATISVAGLGLAWNNLIRTSDLEVRLARAAELNNRLKEMNLAAAGLAHETRNPLSIIRGLAQLIARQNPPTVEVQQRAGEIIAETDRVTAQLNEFINYSRPREVRWSAVPLPAVAAEVARALASDLEEHGLVLRTEADLPTVEADEQLLRQALFNLLLNAIQAGTRGGIIEIGGRREAAGTFQLEVRDDGPGVAPEHAEEIFKPYFTTREVGTGLGLAIVQQIVLAHGWEIEYRPNQPRGAVFRISRMRIAARG